MSTASIFTKLNLKEQREIVVLNAPASFESALKGLKSATILRDVRKAKRIDFLLAFVTTRQEIDRIANAIARLTEGDAVVWFAYPKGTSKRYRCDVNRDTGWEPLGKAGFEHVRLVAIDEDWSALRFRRVEFVKTMARRRSFAITKQGKARTRT